MWQFAKMRQMSSLKKDIGKPLLDLTNDEKAKKNGTRSKIFLKNGTYTGEWLNDLRHGKGIFEWRSGAVYSGDWAWGRRHGHGVLTEVCPRTCQLLQYNGQWCCDQRQGTGLQFYADNKSYEGEWYRNRRHGWGRMFYQDGSLYEGEWVMGIREGKGLLLKADGSLYEGKWHKDIQHGPGLYEHRRTGQLQQGVWVDGIVRSSTMEDKNRQFALHATPYPLPPLELLHPDQVLQEAEQELLPLIPEQHRQASKAGSVASSVSVPSLYSFKEVVVEPIPKYEGN